MIFTRGNIHGWIPQVVMLAHWQSHRPSVVAPAPADEMYHGSTNIMQVYDASWVGKPATCRFSLRGRDSDSCSGHISHLLQLFSTYMIHLSFLTSPVPFILCSPHCHFVLILSAPPVLDLLFFTQFSSFTLHSSISPTPLHFPNPQSASEGGEDGGTWCLLSTNQVQSYNCMVALQSLEGEILPGIQSVTPNTEKDWGQPCKGPSWWQKFLFF